VLSSKEIISKTGISRGTLNNYISLGILPRPLVRSPDDSADDARRLGYFPETVLDRIREIQALKDRGMTMAEISARYSGQSTQVGSGAPAAAAATPAPATAAPPLTDQGREGLRVTIDSLPEPAYMVNYNFEITWLNDAARRTVLGGLDALPSSTEARNVFRFLLGGQACTTCEPCHELLRFHFALAKHRAPASGLFTLCKDAPAEQLGLLDRLFHEAEPASVHPIAESIVNAPGEGGHCSPYHVYALAFREGILFVYVPGGPGSDSLLALLSRRDEVIRDLVRRRLPVLTHVAVLVADLQDSVRICSELPPEEYFELINQIWSAMEPIFRRYYGTYGKHAGDGMVYYFFPQPDCSYVMNALVAAQEMRATMQRISKEWQLRKGWSRELYLNTGLNEGQEWLGTFQTASHVEFTVLGDTINHAARLSDFARYGAVWATKHLMGRLTAEQRQRVRFGVRRSAEQGREVFVASTYANVGGLMELSGGRLEKLKDIATVPITEIVDVAEPA
jgi:class 3 adenylate cyclase/DNA-binding transcriptional MerR regulator